MVREVDGALEFTSEQRARFEAEEREREARRERAWGTQTVRRLGDGTPVPRFGDDEYVMVLVAGGLAAVESLRVERGDANAYLCEACGERHGFAFDVGEEFTPSPIAQVRRDLWEARRTAVRAKAMWMLGAVDRALGVTPERDTALTVLSPRWMAYFALVRSINGLAEWLVPLVDGTMPRRVCQRCGSTDRVQFREKRTHYSACDGGDDPDANFGGILCQSCADDQDAFWEEQWAEYRSSQGV